MKHRSILRACVIAGIVGCALVGGSLTAQSNKDSVKVEGGLALSEFKGYENWEIVAPSYTEAAHVLRAILANPVMIKAYRDGIPKNGKPFPDGSRIVKMEWEPKSITDVPFNEKTPDTVAGQLKELEFIVKDSKRFPDTHGWGYAAFKYDPATDKLTPVDQNDKPPQAHDAKCGAACHELAVNSDFIFTGYPKR
jgi:hypothetical protein